MGVVIPEDNRFESDPDEVLPEDAPLPAGWSVEPPDPADRFVVARLTQLLRDHERQGRGWAGSSVDDVLVEVSEQGLRMRENVVLRDPSGEIRAWGSVHDRAEGRMLFLHVVERGLPDDVADRCSDVLVEWSVGQAREVGRARGLPVQQIDTGAFADDERQHRWLSGSGFERVRTWWQMSRPVTADEADLVEDPSRWEDGGVVFRRVRRAGTGMPDESDLRELHEVLEGAFVDHFNSYEETFEEFLHRLREDPGHRWDHWWLAELTDVDEPQPVGALVGTVSESPTGPDGSYVAYLGVLEAARGRGVAKGLLRTIIADAAARGRDRVGLEVDADSPTGAAGLYESMGWKTKYVTESWHRNVPLD
jgi:ribosomal protein S18 acetylase RimI-like enzyme